MTKNPCASLKIALVITVSILALSWRSAAISFISTPSFTPSASAPLAGLLHLTTDVDSRLSVLVSDGTSTWERDFYDFTNVHAQILLGFKPGRTNTILVNAYDAHRNSCTMGQALTFVTPALPSDFPTSKVLVDQPDRMEPGYTLFILQNRSTLNSYITLIDNLGDPVWYTLAPGNFDVEVKQLGDGNLFLVDAGNLFREINMLGQTVNSWTPPATNSVDLHDGILTQHGTILFISQWSRVVSNFPSSDTVSNAPLKTATIDDKPIVEISTNNGSVLNYWSPMDMLDPTRVTYLTYTDGDSRGVDNEHVNAVLEDTNDNSIIVSVRNQNAVFKFSRTNEQVKWILGPPANWSTKFMPYLLTPVGTPFAWSYGQHAPTLTPQGTLLLYDDGIDRASPFDPPVADQNNYSRAVEYEINETNMTVTQVWDSSQAGGDRLYTPIIGKAQWLPQRRNVLVTYGYVTYINGVRSAPNSARATMVRVIEYTHDPIPQVVFDLSYFDYTNTSPAYPGYFLYRATRVSDLYAHPANPVAQLVLADVDNIPHLEFSADPAHNYFIRASSDLQKWTTIGTPIQQGAGGDFDFYDLSADAFRTRYYRVMTQ
jgi:hypothetical protein